MPYKDPEVKKRYKREYWKDPEVRERQRQKRRERYQKKRAKIKKNSLSRKQRSFKRRLEQGKVDLLEAVKRTYPDNKDPVVKLAQLRQNPILERSIQKYLAAFAEEGIDGSYIAKKYKTILEKTSPDSSPRQDTNTLKALQQIEKMAGFYTERSESINLNINTELTPEEVEFMKEYLRGAGKREQKKVQELTREDESGKT